MSDRSSIAHLAITPLSPTIGAVVSKVDLAARLDDGAIETITQALLTY